MYKFFLFTFPVFLSCKEYKLEVKNTNRFPSVVIHKVPVSSDGPFFTVFVKDGIESVRKQDSIFLDYTNDKICYAKDTFLFPIYAYNKAMDKREWKYYDVWIFQGNEKYVGEIGTFYCECRDTTVKDWNTILNHKDLHEVKVLFLNNQHNNRDSIETQACKFVERKICPLYNRK
jgi:hypothetical protein